VILAAKEKFLFNKKSFVAISSRITFKISLQ